MIAASLRNSAGCIVPGLSVLIATGVDLFQTPERHAENDDDAVLLPNLSHDKGVTNCSRCQRRVTDKPLNAAVITQASYERMDPLCRQRHLSGYRSRTRTRTLTLKLTQTLTLFLTLTRTLKIKENKTTPEYRSTKSYIYNLFS